MDKEHVLNQYNQKWGFGMAPLKSKTEYKYKKAVYSVYKILKECEYKETLTDDISVFKGLVNRCIRQDQWDWFTVYAKFGEPNPLRLKRILPYLISLRKGLKDEDDILIEKSRSGLLALSTLELCEYFSNERSVEDDEKQYGYIYILSRREQSEILKIGMTNRSVEKRVKEINSATGVLFPYGARGVFKVRDARLSEKLIFEELTKYRIRKDREFFMLDFRRAGKLIGEVLKDNNMFI